MSDAFGCPGCGRPWDVPGTDPILCPTCWLILARPPGDFHPGAARAGSLAAIVSAGPPEPRGVVAAGVQNAGVPEARRLVRLHRRGFPRASLAAARLIANALRLKGIPRSLGTVAPLRPGRDRLLAGLVALHLGFPILGSPGQLTSCLWITDVRYKGDGPRGSREEPIRPPEQRLAVLVDGWHR